MPESTAQSVLAASEALAEAVEQLDFSEPTTHVYNPLRYAWEAHRTYVERYAGGKKRVIFLGMNPGPFGMAQCGVPFGEISLVRDWLGIETKIGKPDNEHPKRPVEGFACERSEVSGRRLWGTFKDRFGTPEAFFRDHFVANYCPLVFMEATGKNRTPDKMPTVEAEPLYEVCDAHLRAVVAALQPEWVIGVGAFAESRAKIALKDADFRTGRVLHPSPASPAANRGWAEQATAQMEKLGLW
ncbi:MAG: uracil-DNA glycosylase family protein [Verrucomicrobiota bacterium]